MEQTKKGQAYLADLIQQINEKRAEYEKVKEEVDEGIAKKGHEYMLKIAELEKKLNSPGKIEYAYDSLREKESELIAYREELDDYAKRQSELESKLSEKESLLISKESELQSLWLEAYNILLNNLRLSSKSLLARGEYLKVREDTLNARAMRLNDQINSFKAAQEELNGKRKT